MKPLLNHQRDALAFLDRRDYRGAIFMEPGLGKTRVGCEIAKRANRTLVIAPLNPALFVWPDQTKQWAPRLSFALARGTAKERARILFDQKPDICVINYELLHWFYDEVRTRRKLPYDVAILDESSAVKNGSSIAHRALKALEPAFDAMIPMNGTPAGNSLHDLWGQLYFVDAGETLGKKVGVFRERYCQSVMRENYATWKVVRGQELRRAAAPLCFVRRSADCLDMPPLVFQDVKFELSKKEQAFYDKIKKEHLVPLSTPMVLENAGVALNKLRQTTSGFVYDEEQAIHHVGDSKVQALLECIEESFGAPMLVGFWFQASKVKIRRALGYDVPTIDRFTPARDKARYLEAWNAGEIPVLLGQVKTVALGLNMQSLRASICFYDLPWSHETHWQFIQRVWRQGQATRVVVRRLIANRTVDGYVANVLKTKKQNEDELMSAILDEELI